MKKLSDIDKRLIELARKDWNRQQKNFKLYNIPFKDESLRLCLERYKKMIEGEACS